MPDDMSWLGCGKGETSGFCCPNCQTPQPGPPAFEYDNFVMYHCKTCGYDWRVWSGRRQLPLWGWLVVWAAVLAVTLFLLFGLSLPGPQDP